MISNTFEEIPSQQMQIKQSHAHRYNYSWGIQIYGNIVCYNTMLICNSDVLCLDWRYVCDGVHQCLTGYDEEKCHILEVHECENNAYQCLNSMCISLMNTFPMMTTIGWRSAMKKNILMILNVRMFRQCNNARE